MLIWIIQTGEPIQIDKGLPRPMRGINLSNFLRDKNHEVRFLTANFNHAKKKHRSEKLFSQIIIDKKLTLNLINSPGYKKTIGLARIFDHLILSINLFRFLWIYKGRKPDFIFIGFPPIETSFVLALWALQKKIPFAIDVKDKWPVIFLEVFPRRLRPYFQLPLLPYTLSTKFIFRKANLICSMSQSYLNWIEKYVYPKKIKNKIAIPLTAPKVQFNKVDIELAYKWWENKNVFNNDSPKIIFIGSLSSAFDFSPILEAAEHFNKSNSSLQFIIAGSGPMEENLKLNAIRFDNIIFPGFIEGAKISTLYAMAKASITPYRSTSNFIDNIPNKVIDSLSYGVPLISSLEGEIKNLIKKNEIGFHFTNSKNLIIQINNLINQRNLSEKLSFNSKNTYDKYFNFEKSYERLLKKILTFS